MTTFATEQLPPPTAIEFDRGTPFQLSSGFSDGKRLSVHVVDDSLKPRRWSLAYAAKRRETIDALRRHFEAFAGTSFEWLPPGEDVVLRVIYTEPTAISWRNPSFGDARVFIEEAMAY